MAVLVFDKEACRSGWRFAISGALTVEASGEILFMWRRFGDRELVVIVVVAVGGRSRTVLDIAAFDEAGNIPVISSLRILDFMSSSSSQTVEGAVVDTVDSVPSAWGV